MKDIGKIFTAIVASALISSGALAQDVAPKPLMIAVSPRLGSEQSKAVEADLLKYLLGRVPRGTPVTLLDAYGCGQVLAFSIPSEALFDEPRLRANKMRRELVAIHSFFERAAASAETDAAMREPQLLKTVGSSAGRDRALILIGNPLYLDLEEKTFSMAGYFPSDGHLVTTPDRSVFSVAGREQLLDGVRIHQCTMDHPWTSEVHNRRVERFWALYAQMQGGSLVTFAPDLGTVFQRALDPSSKPTVPFTFDAADRSVVMHDLERDPVLRATLALPEPPPAPQRKRAPIAAKPKPAAAPRQKKTIDASSTGRDQGTHTSGDCPVPGAKSSGGQQARGGDSAP